MADMQTDYFRWTRETQKHDSPSQMARENSQREKHPLVYEESVPSEGRREVLSLLYNETCSNWRELTDVRFKLLGFVPLISGAGVVFLQILGNRWLVPPIAQLVIAALGLVTTLALWIYERRNTQLYSDLGNLNERIENELGIGEGQFSGARSKAAWPITHGVSIYLVYGASALSWLFTVIYIGRSEKVIEPILLQQQALSPWQQAAWVFTILGVIVAAGSLVVSAIANRQNAASQEETARANEDTSRAERARFLLDLRTMFASHDKVHVDLKPGSKWGAIRTVLEEHDAYKKYGFAPTEEGPSTPQEWAPVEAYMGLFELCEMMLKEDLINEDTFKSLYRYRLTNIMCNKVIVNQKIVDRASGWEGFRALLDRCAVPKQVREPWEETIRSRDVAMSQTPHKVGILQRALGFFASCSGRPTRKKSP